MNATATQHSPADALNAACAAINLTMTAVFVPFSQSRNATARDGAEKPWRSLNWRVTLERNGRAFLTTDYSQGEGHAPAAKWKGKAYGQQRAIDIEIETGMVAGTLFSDEPRATRKPIAPPSLADVVYSLASDSSVLDSSGFEDWANEFGYDTDSRSAEATYRACLDIALKMRGAIGEAGLQALRTASEGY